MLIDSIMQALVVVTTPTNLLFILTGTFAGIVIGAIPGIGPALGTALVLPFTVYVDPLPALLFIVSLYDGAMYGGSISSILLNTPGDGAAAASTLEGFPMARQGKAITALSISSMSSALGGLAGGIIAVLGSAFMLSFLLLFGTPEYFLLGIFGIVLVSLVSKGAYYKGLISGLMGLAVTTVGICPGSTCAVRYTMGSLSLYDGISFLPVLLGLFGVATMAKLYGEKKKHISAIDTLGGSRMEGVMATFRYWKTLIKSSIIGFIIGAIPGAGGTVATFVAYGEAVRSAKHRDTFGKGNPEGLVATESSNNACIKGAIVPTLLFGIPGSATTAVVLAAMLLHGLRPGTGMFQGEGYVLTLAMFLGLFYSEVVIAVVGLSSVRFLGKITTLDKHIIIPFVIILSVLGIFCLNFNWVDLVVMAVAGLVGFLLVKYGFPVVPAVIGVVLGKIIEENLIRTMELGEGTLRLLVERPISIILMVLTVAVIAVPFLGAALKARK